MSIFIDDRIGSKHLQPLIPGSELARLDSGDACWMGAQGQLVGVEVKRLSDAVQCLYTGRLADVQVPAMRERYDHSYLIIEGVWRPEPGTGVLQQWREFDGSKEVKCGKWQDVTTGRKRLLYSSFELYLSTMGIQGGVMVRSTPSPESTAALLSALYNWWQRSDHNSFNVLHQHQGDGASLSRPTMLRRMLALLPHVLWERSAILLPRIGRVEFYRKDGKPMKPEDWYIPGQIAQRSADDIVRALNDESD